MTTPAGPGSVQGLRIGVVNWRDEGHPAAGGAEMYAGEMARGLARRGAHVTFLTARGRGQLRCEVVDGVRYLRRGGRWSVYLHVLLRLLIRRRRLDVVLDCQNGIPFFTPLVLRRRTPVICVVHHCHQEQFAMHFPAWLAAIGRWLEGPVARRVYGRRAAIAVSPGTRTAMRRRLHWRGPIYVVPNGTPAPVASDAPRADVPTVVTVARLVPHKRLGLLVTAAARLATTHPDLRVHIVGGGPDEAPLRDLVKTLGISDLVEVHGHVDEQTKADLLASAWITVNPTAGEGWGLGVMEAAATGVPTLAYDVDGMRDSIRPTVTGWLLPEGADIAPVLGGLLDCLADPTAAATVALACSEWAAAFDWDDSVDRITGVISGERLRLGDRRARSRDRRRHPSDLVTLAEFSVAEPTAFVGRTAAVLRPTDRFGVEGSEAWVLVYGADDVDLDSVVDRLGGIAPRYRIALGPDLVQRKPDLAVVAGTATVPAVPAA